MRTARCRAISAAARRRHRRISERRAGGRDRAARNRQDLICDEAAHAFDDDRAAPRPASCGRLRASSASARAGRAASCRPAPAAPCGFCLRRRKPGAEAAQVAVDGLAVVADGGLECLGRRSAVVPLPAMAPSITALIIEPLCLGERIHVESSASRAFCSTISTQLALDRSGRRPSRSFRPSHRSGWSMRWRWCGPA